MAVEKVQLNVTLSGGECVWQKGTVLSSPLPPAILKEIELNTGTVTVLESSDDQEKPLTASDVVAEIIMAKCEQVGISEPVIKKRGRPFKKDSIPNGN